jgi:hypothetical protein
VGETAVVDYEVTLAPGKPCEVVERRFTRPPAHYLMQVAFHPDAIPARGVEFHRPAAAGDGVEEHELWLGPTGTHMTSLSTPPGVAGIRWEWA